jgi:urease accessory protein
VTLMQSDCCDGLIEIAVEADEMGRLRYCTLRSMGALAVRIADHSAWIVGASASPVGGDELRVEMSVAEGASLSVRSTSATLARAAARPIDSHIDISAVVGKGSGLRWSPEPTIAAAGSSHRSTARVVMQPDSWLVWSEAITLGRSDEEWGSSSSQLRVDIDGRPKIVSSLEVGPAYSAWSSSAVMNGARSVWSVVIIDGRIDNIDSSVQSHTSLVMPLQGGGVQFMSWGDSILECKAELSSLLSHGTLLAWRERGFIFEQETSDFGRVCLTSHDGLG